MSQSTVVPQKRPARSSARHSSAPSSRTQTYPRSTSELRDNLLVALIDNAVKEVGLCVFNVSSYDIELRQFADYNTYSSTLSILRMLDPAEIILSSSSYVKALHEAIGQHPDLCLKKLTFLNHIYFNETAGELAINNFSISSCPNLATFGMSNCYLSIACCGALIRYVEETEQAGFVPSTLRIRLRPNHIKMFLDLGAIEGLEVVSSQRSSAAEDMGVKTDLFSVVDYTRTRAGKRLLRRDLLEPHAIRDNIELRQLAASAFRESETMYSGVVTALKKFPDLERSIATLLKSESVQLAALSSRTNSSRLDSLQIDQTRVQNQSRHITIHDGGPGHSVDNSYEQQNAEHSTGSASVRQEHSADWNGNETENSVDEPMDEGYGENVPSIRVQTPPSDLLIQTLINVKASLSLVPKLCNAISGTDSVLLGTLCSDLRAVQYEDLYSDICEVIDENAMPMKDVEAMRNQAVLAIKSGRIGRLDLYRALLGELKADMDEITRDVREAQRLQKVQLKYHMKRGYYLVAPRMEVDRCSLPAEFTVLDRGALKVSFTTPDLDNLSIRFQEALAEIWTMTAVEVGFVIEKVLEKRSLMALYGLCDKVALLDILTSFVTYAAFTPIDMAQPRFYSKGPLVLKRAHHPLLLHANPETSVPNNVCLCLSSNVHIITGRNQAGKSTMIRMVGSVVVLAHIGCFVPAEAMVCPLVDRICSRLNNNHDVSQCASHFSREMRDLAAIQKAIPRPFRRGALHAQYPNADTNVVCSSASVPTTGSTSSAENSSKIKLVLIDELGRATSVTHGFAIAWAVLEDLSRTPNIYSLFTTHFQGLTALTALCPMAQSFYLQALVDEREQAPITETGAGRVRWGANQGTGTGTGTQQVSRSKVKFTYKLCGGSMDDTWYGLDTAQKAGFPEEVVRDAEQLRDQVPASSMITAEAFIRKHVFVSAGYKAELKRLRKVARFHRHKTCIEYSGAPHDEIQQMMRELRQRFAHAETESMSKSGSGNLGSSRAASGSNRGGTACPSASATARASASASANANANANTSAGAIESAGHNDDGVGQVGDGDGVASRSN